MDAPSELVGIGNFGFVCLIDSSRQALEFECIVLESGAGGTVVIGTPGTALLTDSGEWIEVTKEAVDARASTSPVLSVDSWEMPIVLKRVAHLAIAGGATGGASPRLFTNASMIAARPPVRATLAAYWQQDEPVTASETDAGATLRMENARLRKALAQAQEQMKGGGAAGSSSRLAVRPLPTFIGEEDESFAEAEEGSDEEDIFDGLMAVPMKPLPKTKGRKPGAGGGGKVSLTRHAAPSEAPVAASAGDMQTQLMFEMLKHLRETQNKAGGEQGDLDAPDNHELDGVRVLRTLSRMRALKAQLRRDPERICREYQQRWEEELGAEGKPWRWIDLNRSINFGKFKSIRRVHAMFCHVLEADMAANTREEHLYVRALMIQCMKALHEFSAQGDWRTAWPLTHFPDPVNQNPLGGTELEMECVLAVLKTKDDLRQKARQSREGSGHQASNGEEEEEGPKGKGDPKKKGKKKKEGEA